MGIPPEHQDRIFDRFYQVPLRPGERVEGAGLGLSICQAIVEEHGGRIWVQSAPGRGSTFFFTLPQRPVAG
jgi:signal transduction histidine kinase